MYVKWRKVHPNSFHSTLTTNCIFVLYLGREERKNFLFWAKTEIYNIRAVSNNSGSGVNLDAQLLLFLTTLPSFLPFLKEMKMGLIFNIVIERLSISYALGRSIWIIFHEIHLDIYSYRVKVSWFRVRRVQWSTVAGRSTVFFHSDEFQDELFRFSRRTKFQSINCIAMVGFNLNCTEV